MPSKYGIGYIRDESYRFVDFMKSSGQKLWQISPFSSPDFFGFPYASSSAFDRYINYIDLEQIKNFIENDLTIL